VLRTVTVVECTAVVSFARFDTVATVALRAITAVLARTGVVACCLRQTIKFHQIFARIYLFARHAVATETIFASAVVSAWACRQTNSVGVAPTIVSVALVRNNTVQPIALESSVARAVPLARASHGARRHGGTRFVTGSHVAHIDGGARASSAGEARVACTTM
jgi:hypothetical protein